MLVDILLLLVGIVVGAMNAIAGGGMLLGFPILLAVGLPAIVANASSAVIVLPGQLASAYGYRRYLRTVPKQYLLLIIPCAVGAAIGAYLLRNTSQHYFQEIVPGLILFAVVLFAFQPLLHFHVHQHLRSRNRDLSKLLIIGLALLPIGIYGGYFGAGFGFVLLAFLGFTSLHDVHKMNALKNLAAASMAIVSITCLAGSGLIDWHHGLVMAVGSLIGGYFGAIFALKIPSHAVRIVVIIIGLSAAVYLAIRSY